jgi:hypothetical protein
VTKDALKARARGSRLSSLFTITFTFLQLKLPMHQYAVFLGAPPSNKEAFTENKTEYRWSRFSSGHMQSTAKAVSLEGTAGYPPATLAEAGRRLSNLYQNVIFNDQEAGEDLLVDNAERSERSILGMADILATSCASPLIVPS